MIEGLKSNSERSQSARGAVEGEKWDGKIGEIDTTPGNSLADAKKAASEARSGDSDD